MLNPYRLGASLYVPATHKDLLAIANGEKLPELRSAIFCTEDSITSAELDWGLSNLKHCLAEMSASCRLLRFVRVRNPEVLIWLLSTPGVEKLDGFVLPKVERSNVDLYMNLVQGSQFLVMPTLETREVFDPQKMTQLRDHILERGWEKHILALRIGGNDLLSILDIRRPRDRTLYRTPLGYTIAQIVTLYKPYGFKITAPVFEHIDRPELLKKELSEDIAHGLVGKTAIHPSQLSIIDAAYRISPADLEAARRILQGEQAVFQFDGSMCELATHTSWAYHIVEQAAAERK